MRIKLDSSGTLANRWGWGYSVNSRLPKEVVDDNKRRGTSKSSGMRTRVRLRGRPEVEHDSGLQKEGPGHEEVRSRLPRKRPVDGLMMCWMYTPAPSRCC